MEIFKHTLMIVISSFLLAISSYPCCAADPAFKDAGMAETPTERALLVFTSNSSDQLDYLTNGAGTDPLRVANFTTAKPKSLIAIEGGSITISFPVISPEFQGNNNAKGFAGVIVKAELISGTF